MATNNFDNIFATGNIEASGYFIFSGVPTSPNHLANKYYVDLVSTSLSGANNRINELVQDILVRPDNASFRAYQTIIDQRFSTLESQYNELFAQYKTLQNLYTNLFITVSNRYAEFTGHTGKTTDVHGL